MEKLQYLCGGIKSVPNVWQPCHVLEIVNYLISRGYNYELYKEIDSSKYILVNRNALLFFKRASEVCESLKDLYFSEKQEEEIEYFRSRNQKQRKNSILLGGLYEKN